MPVGIHLVSGLPTARVSHDNKEEVLFWIRLILRYSLSSGQTKWHEDMMFMSNSSVLCHASTEATSAPNSQENQRVCVLERKDSQISLMELWRPAVTSLVLSHFLHEVGWEDAGLSDHTQLQLWEVPNLLLLLQKIPVGSNDLILMNPSSTGGPLLSPLCDPKEASNLITHLNCDGCMPAQNLSSTLGSNSVLTVTTVKQEKLKQK